MFSWRRSLWGDGHMKILQGVALACTILLAACTGLRADPAREAQADKVLQQVIAGDTAGLQGQGSSQLNTPELPAQVAQMRSVLPRVEPPEGRTVSWTHQVGTGGEQYAVEREYTFPDHVIVSRTLMIKAEDGRWRVAGFHFNGGTRAEAEAAGFTLGGKSMIHYLVLVALVVVPLFIVATTGTALYRRRWGWAALSLFSVFAFKLNWMSGAWSFMPISFNLLGAGFMKAGAAFAPWILTVGLPLPAILFWALGKNRPKPPKARKVKSGDAVEAPVPEATPDS